LETANNIITDALKEIAALPAESDIPQDKAETGIFYLNAMMGDFSVKGINLGYTYVNDLSDQITIDDFAIEVFIKNLAIELIPTYGHGLTDQSLFQAALDGYKSLQEIALTTPAPMAHPSRFPTGSGNQTTRTDEYYDEPRDPILREDNGGIAPEVDESES
jgi:hypothetical protein